MLAQKSQQPRVWTLAQEHTDPNPTPIAADRRDQDEMMCNANDEECLASTIPPHTPLSTGSTALLNDESAGVQPPEALLASLPGVLGQLADLFLEYFSNGEGSLTSSFFLATHVKRLPGTADDEFVSTGATAEDQRESEEIEVGDGVEPLPGHAPAKAATMDLFGGNVTALCQSCRHLEIQGISAFSACYVAGEVLFQMSRHSAAVACFSNVGSADSLFSLSQYRIALTLEQMETCTDSTRAVIIEHYERAWSTISPHSFYRLDLMLSLGTQYAKSGHAKRGSERVMIFDRAEKLFIKAVRDFPMNPRAKIGLVHILMLRSKWSDAKRILVRMVDLGKGGTAVASQVAYYLLATCQEQLGKRWIAYENYKRASALAEASRDGLVVAIVGDAVGVLFEAAGQQQRAADMVCAHSLTNSYRHLMHASLRLPPFVRNVYAHTTTPINIAHTDCCSTSVRARNRSSRRLRAPVYPPGRGAAG